VRRADRLFRLLLELRRGRVVTAQTLARRLEVSERTVYRDVADLSASGVPIAGEAGVGYRLMGFELPPLVFERDEVEALVLGARVAEGWGDAELARAAGTALAKIEAALPKSRAHLVDETRLYAPTWGEPPGQRLPLGRARRAIRERRVLDLDYRDEKGAATRREVRPLALAFYPPVWLLVAWCELRRDFRNFRLDRCVALEPTGATFVDEPGKTLADFTAAMAARAREHDCARREAAGEPTSASAAARAARAADAELAAQSSP
jgi:predicted DNA-binding transcriptional regulator YafY